jgi:hypothetical protein
MQSFDSQSNVERIMLERFKFGVRHMALQEDLQFLSDVDIEYMTDSIARNVVYNFRAEVMGQKLDQIKHPADWKEAFKERWFPKWLLEKYPVRYKRYDIKALYPQIKLPIDGYRPVIHVHSVPDFSKYE